VEKVIWVMYDMIIRPSAKLQINKQRVLQLDEHGELISYVKMNLKKTVDAQL